MFDPVDLILRAPPILFALSFHEFAHAWSAYKLGDMTAKNNGRLTLNPLAHLDFLGTLMMFTSHFGWAKPVPVNPSFFKNPPRDMAITAVAGPLSNLISAVAFGLTLRFIIAFDLSLGRELIYMIKVSVFINLALTIFNLIPIPPLDGSRILMYFGKFSLQQQMHFEQIGPILLIALIIIGYITPVNIIGLLIWPFVSVASLIIVGAPL